MASAHRRLMLPYNRGPRPRGGSPLSEEGEIALVLLVSEEKRKKGGFFSGTEQKIKFVSKFYYPFLLTPWKDRSLILNPISRGSLTFRHSKLPNMDSFIGDLKRSSTARELYQVFLMDNLDTFRQRKEQKVSLDRVISKEFGETLAKEARTAVSGPEQSSLILEGQVDEGNLQQEVEKFVNANDKIEEDVLAVEYALAQLQEGGAMHIKKIKEQIKETREKYEQEIIRVRPFVQKRIETMRRDKDNEMRTLRKSSKEELTVALKEKATQQRELMKLERLEAKCQREKKARKAVDKAAYNFWDNRLDKVKKEISNVRKAASKATKKVDAIRYESERRVLVLAEQFDRRLDEELIRIDDLKISSASEVEEMNYEVEELKKNTSQISVDMKELMLRMEEEKSSITNLTSPVSPESKSLLCIPMYVVKYESDMVPSYAIYPPISTEDEQERSHRKIFGKSSHGLADHLTPRFDEYREFAEAFQKLIPSDGLLEIKINEIGVRNNILNQKNLEKMILKGVDEISSRGWIDKTDGSALFKSIRLISR
ncbi:MAG: hypothetical protein O7B30_00150 [Thaumarchaeota archaeon]|nr:hypothetical protein [Nitrososphaerota archaeon]